MWFRNQVRILYVRNLVVSTTEEELEQLFNAASDDGVEKVKILNDFAFVHFVSRCRFLKMASLSSF